MVYIELNFKISDGCRKPRAGRGKTGDEQSDLDVTHELEDGAEYHYQPGTES